MKKCITVKIGEILIVNIYLPYLNLIEFENEYVNCSALIDKCESTLHYLITEGD